MITIFNECTIISIAIGYLPSSPRVASFEVNLFVPSIYLQNLICTSSGKILSPKVLKF